MTNTCNSNYIELQVGLSINTGVRTNATDVTGPSTTVQYGLIVLIMCGSQKMEFPHDRTPIERYVELRMVQFDYWRTRTKPSNGCLRRPLITDRCGCKLSEAVHLATNRNEWRRITGLNSLHGIRVQRKRKEDRQTSAKSFSYACSTHISSRSSTTCEKVLAGRVCEDSYAATPGRSRRNEVRDET